MSGAPQPRRIAVVTYFFPPSTAVGAHRWASMTRHLRARGHEVVVITSTIHGALPDDDGRVLRTGDLANAAGLRKLLRRPPVPAPGAAAPQTPAPALLTDVVPPDSHLVSWAPSALRALIGLMRHRPLDCVITSGPPDSAHLVALALGRRRPAWIADFRDGWRFEPLRPPWPHPLQERADRRLEEQVARRADVVLGATSPIATDFRERLGADAHWVTNGFDGDLAMPAQPPRGLPDPDWRTLAHTGTLSGPRGRDPRPFLAALTEFNAGRAAGEPRVRLVLAGRPSVADERLIADAAAGPAVEHLGLLDRSASLTLQRESDALLLLTGSHRSEATGKLFEYLAAGRPIVAVAAQNEAARIVRETGTGRVVDPHAPDAVTAALQAVADGTLEREYAPHGLERFRYPGPAQEVASLVERAIAWRLSFARAGTLGPPAR